MPAGSSRGERLDPSTFPLRAAAVAGRAADAAPALREGTIALERPLSAYRGIALRMEPPTRGTAGAVAVVLEHADPALSLTLYRAVHGADIVAEWRAWGRALSLPLLVAEADGHLREPFERIGAVRVGRPLLRRRRRSSLKARRPALPLRRQPSATTSRAAVHRGERELTASS
jgi:hypothetical protein